MAYSSLSLYYFSGTGNARRAAFWMQAVSEAAGVQATTQTIDHGRPSLPLPEGDRPLVGFLFPIHGFTTVWAMLRFILEFPQAERPVDVFVGATRAGVKIGQKRLPGFEGSGLYLPLLILRQKGYRPVGALPMDMPSNWTSIHPGLPPDAVSDLVAHCREKVTDFISRLLQGERAFHDLAWLPLGVALLPLTAGYLLMGRFALSKTMLADERCNQCGLCQKQCPVDAIEMRDGRPFWTFRCESCMRCLSFCPQSAVQSSLGMIALFVLTSALLIPAALRALGVGAENQRKAKRLVDGAGIDGFVLGWPVRIGLIGLMYAGVHALMRYRPVRRLFGLASPSRHWRRYHEPETRYKDFS